MYQIDRWLVALGSIIVLACDTPSPVTAPTRLSLGAPAATRVLEAASRSSRVRVPIPNNLKQIGCVAVHQSSDGVTSIASIPRTPMQAIIGSLDSIDAPVILGRATSGLLHILTAQINVTGLRGSVAINCLASMAITQGSFDQLAQSAAEHMVLDHQQFHAYSNSQEKPDFILASDVLLSPVRDGSSPSFILMGSTATKSGPKYFHPKYDLECGPGTDYACGSPTLPTVTVTASPGYPIIVDLSWLIRRDRIYSLSDLVGVYFYDGPTCANASDTWLAINDIIQREDEEANEMSAATTAVATQTCELQQAANGDICVDLFIMSAQAAFLLGDDRTFDPNAPFKASRAQLYINPQTCSVASWVNTSRTTGLGPLNGGPYGPHRLNKVTATMTGAGCVVEWTLFNGYCEGHVPTPLCPAIDGRFVIAGNASNGWSANVNEDKFPSRGIYFKRNGQWETVSERQETIWLDLGSKRRNIEFLRISRDQAMPPGCELQ